MMAEDLKTLREASHVIEGLGARLEQSIAGLSARLEQANSEFKDRLDLAIAGINARLALMTAVFAICVGLGGAAFWNISSKIDTATTKLSLVDAKASGALEDQLSRINDKMARILALADKISPDTDKDRTGSAPLFANISTLLKALQIASPPPDISVVVLFYSPLAAEEYVAVKGRDLVAFLGSKSGAQVVRIEVPDDPGFYDRLGKAVESVGGSSPH